MSQEQRLLGQRLGDDLEANASIDDLGEVCVRTQEANGEVNARDWRDVAGVIVLGTQRLPDGGVSRGGVRPAHANSEWPFT